MIQWAYGTISIEGDDLIVRQPVWRKSAFGKRKDLPDAVTIYQIANITLLEVSRDSGGNWQLRVRARSAPGGVIYGGITDYQGLRDLVTQFSDFLPVIWEGESWTRAPIDVRVVASISASGERQPIKCGGCGAPVTSSTRFCPHCGSSLG
jgi:hypothetical protein